MRGTDPYAVLGIGPDSSLDDIRRAYRRLSLRYHPDKHDTADGALRELAEEKFKEIQAAYEGLIRSAAASVGPDPADRTCETPPPPASPPTLDPAGDVAAERIVCLEEAGKSEEATAEAASYARAHPAHGVLAALNGRLLLEAGRFREAIGELQRARRLLGENPDLLALNAIAYEKAGFISHADALFEQVDRIDPNNSYVAARDEAAGIKRGRYSGGPTGNRAIGCGGLGLTLLLFLLWLIAKALT